MSNTLYYTLRTILKPWSYHLRGVERIRYADPAIFVGNHAASAGPLQTILTLPFRLYPWVIAEMADPARIKAYLYKDFIAPELHLSGRIGKLVNHLVAGIALSIIRGIDCIPVDRSRQLYLGAFQRSLAALKQGRNLAIFPEDPQSPLDPVTGLRSFMFGFIYLSFLYRRDTGMNLPIYPLAVLPKRRTVVVGNAQYYSAVENSRTEILRMRAALQDTVGYMLLESGDGAG